MIEVIFLCAQRGCRPSVTNNVSVGVELVDAEYARDCRTVIELSTKDVEAVFGFFFSSRRRHTRWTGDWSSDVCSSDLGLALVEGVRLVEEAQGAGVRLVGAVASPELARTTRGTALRAALESHAVPVQDRSEERRVGKACRTRWAP